MAEGPAKDKKQAAQPASAGRRAWRFAPLAVILAGLALAYAMGWQDYFSLEFLGESRQWLKRLVAGNPVLAPAAFVILYAVAVAFSFPAASILTIFSGFLFGWLAGGVYAVIAATFGATALFLAARSAFGGFLRDKVGGFAARLADGFEKDAFGYLLVLRLAPFIPFLIVNIAPALFDVRLRTFFAATLIGVIPGAFAYAWLGQGVDSVLIAARSAGRDVRVSDLVTPEITAAFVVLALVAALSLIVRRVWGSRAS
jgi:uncharacterized membrane protein YdjX (TVP38/TMEM64 family)